jgi:hypothetical protein
MIWNNKEDKNFFLIKTKNHFTSNSKKVKKSLKYKVRQQQRHQKTLLEYLRTFYRAPDMYM